MPFCQKCGAELSEGSKFCNNCGQEQFSSIIEPTNKEGSITFVRKPCATAKMIKTKVIIDGLEYGALKENEQLIVKLPFGSHSVSLKCGMNPTLSLPIHIDSTDNILFPFKISMSGRPVRLGETNSSVVRHSEVATGEKPKKKHTGMIVALLLVFATFGIIIAFGGEHSDSAETPKTTTTEKASATAEPSFAAYTNTVGNWEITVNDFYYTQNVSVGLIHEYRADEGSKYCIINVTVKNLGNEADTFLPYVVWEGDTVAKIKWEQYEYTRTELAWADDNLSSEALNPLVSTSGNIAFELPDEVIDSGTPPVLVITANGQTYECQLVKN